MLRRRKAGGREGAFMPVTVSKQEGFSQEVREARGNSQCKGPVPHSHPTWWAILIPLLRFRY